MRLLRRRFAPPRNDAAKKAFTLIELTLVTVIILALAGLSAPLFRKTFSDLTAKDTAFNISKLISYAEERAVIDRKNFKITFNFTSGYYRLSESQVAEGKVVYKEIRGRFGKAFTLPQGLSFRDREGESAEARKEEYKKEIVFYPDGRSDPLAIDMLNKSMTGYRITSKGFGAPVGIKEVKDEPR